MILNRKKTYPLIVSCIAGLFLFSVISCKKKDVSAPQISNVSLNFVNDSAVLQLDDTLRISALFTDDNQLNSYRISVYNNFTFLNPSKANQAFVNYYVGELNAVTSQSINHKIVVSDSSLAGPYSVSIEALDSEGNISEKLVKNWILQRNDAPLLNFGALPSSISQNDSLPVNGTITDDGNISSIEVKFINPTDYTQEWNATKVYGDTNVIYLINDDIWHIQLDDAPLGNFWCFLIVRDNIGNYTFEKRSITIE